jgi:hypothetical protein
LARIQVKVHVFPGLPHGFIFFRDLPSTKRWNDVVIQNIKWVLQEQKAEEEAEEYLHVE